MFKSSSSSLCPQCGIDSSEFNQLKGQVQSLEASLEDINKLQAQVKSLKADIQDLTEQAHTDSLTGLGNYKHFSEVLDYEMERTHRTDQATTLIMVDLDHFKKLNDTYGHEAGNHALQETAKLLRDGTRKLDVACRYGGEEFAIILPSTDLLTGAQVAERLRQMISNSPIHWQNQSIPLTASLGVDQYLSNQQTHMNNFIQQVDALLYRAKQNGRNQVCSGTRRDMNSAYSVSSDEKQALFGNFHDPEEPSAEPK